MRPELAPSAATPATFRYGRDPLFLAASFTYVLNRWVLAPSVHSPFLQNYLDDLLLIPCALPLILWIHRRARWRYDDRPPTWAEIGVHWLVWSMVCEGLGPWLLHRGIADPWDVVAYAVGAVVAGWWWHRPADLKVGGRSDTTP